MKKAFTLIEMLIVIVVIGILFSIMGYLSWNYIRQIQIDNDKEILENKFFFTQTSSLSEPSFGKYKDLKYVGIKLAVNNQGIYTVGTTGDVSKIFTVGYDYLRNSTIGTGFFIDGHYYSGEAIFLYKSYNMGLILNIKDTTNHIFTGNKFFKFKLQPRYKSLETQCYKVNLDLGRLFATQCDF